MEAGLDKQRWIYGAERRVMDPDCDHGVALVTSQSHHRVCVASSGNASYWESSF